MTAKITALVTGSTSGIGKAVAESLAANNCNIILNGFGDITEINEYKNSLKKKYKVEVLYDNADMQDAAEIKQMCDSAIEKFGRVDILVNNAGIQHVDNIEDFPESKWEQVLSINLSSAFYTIKYLLPGMKKNNFGRIINIASAHGLVASPKKCAYVAAKHGLVGLTKSIALEVAETNITCNAICPGWVLTPLVSAQIEKIAAKDKVSFEDAKAKLLSEKQPSKRFVMPEEIGDYVVFLSGKTGNNITGSAISIDGGWTAW